MRKSMVTLRSLAAPRGLQTGPFGSQLKAEEYSEYGVPVIMPKNICDGKIVVVGIARVPEEKAKKLAKHRIVTGDILFPRRGELGRIGVASQENEGWLCGTGCLRARLKEEVDTNYVHQYVQLESVKRWLDSNALGQTMLNLNTEIIGNLPIFLVSKSEQTAIADLLSTWDHAIENIEWLIAAKEKHYSWLSCMLLFGNTNCNSHTSKRTRWYTVPDHWKIVKIGSVAKEVKTTNDTGESILVLSCTKYDGLVNSLEYFGKQVFSQNTSTYKVVSRGQFAYATNHIEEGSIGYQNLHDKGLVSPMYTVFETDKSIDDGYLYKVLKTVTYRHIFQVNTSASVDRRGSLRWNEFAKLPIPLPPIDEQQRISEVLNTARQEIDLLKKQAEAFRKQKRGLMQKLLTGQWRVKTCKEDV